MTFIPKFKCDGCGKFGTGSLCEGTDIIDPPEGWEDECRKLYGYHICSRECWAKAEKRGKEPKPPTNNRPRAPRPPRKKYRTRRDRVFERDGHRCRYCGATDDLRVDHIFPRALGGGNQIGNLATACHPCNQRKADRTPEQAGMVLNPIPLGGQA